MGSHYFAAAISAVNLVLLAVIALTGSVTAATERVVRAEAFDVVDASGVVRASLFVSKTGRAGLWILSEDGQHRASLSGDRNVAALSLEEPEGGKILITTQNERRQFVMMSMENKESRAMFTPSRGVEVDRR